MQVFIGRRAERNIDSIAQYISMQGYPETAVKFITRLRSFIYQIADFPAKYPICRQKAYARRGLRCAVFEKHYIVVYKVYPSKILIMNVVHTAKIRE